MSLGCTSHLTWSVATSWLSVYHLPLLVIQLLHVCLFHALISVWFLIYSLFKIFIHWRSQMFIPIHRQVKGIGQELISVFYIGRDLFHPITNTQINCIFKTDSERKKILNALLSSANKKPWTKQWFYTSKAWSSYLSTVQSLTTAQTLLKTHDWVRVLHWVTYSSIIMIMGIVVIF